MVSSADIAGSVVVSLTILADQVGVVTEEMTVWDRRGALDGSITTVVTVAFRQPACVIMCSCYCSGGWFY